MEIDAIHKKQVMSIHSSNPNASIPQNTGKPNEQGKHGSAAEVTLSASAQSILQSMSGMGGPSGQNSEFLNDVFRGVSEQLQEAKHLGGAGQKAIEAAGAKFDKAAKAIFKEAGGQPLNQSQLDRLAEADDAFHAVVDQYQGNSPDLSSSQSQLLEQTEASIQSFLEQFEKTAEKNGGITDKQRQALEKAEEELSKTLDKVFSSNKEVSADDRKSVESAVAAFQNSMKSLFAA